MTVSAITVDARTLHRNTPDHVFSVRSGSTVQVRRDVDRERLEAERDYLLREGAEEV